MSRRAARLAVLAALASASPAAAQPGTPVEAQSNGALARAVQNPIGDLTRFPIQNNANGGTGPRRGVQNIMELQPIIPFRLDEDWNLKTRTTLPLTWQPAGAPGAAFGLGATTLSLYLAPRRPRDGFSWGLGPVVQIPTATDPALGSPVWGAGPSMILVHAGGPWVSGILAYNLWSLGGTPGRAGTRYSTAMPTRYSMAMPTRYSTAMPTRYSMAMPTRYSTMQVQLFTNYNFGDGWFVGAAPTINADWLARGNRAWTLPVGGHVGQLFRIDGRLPVNWLLGAYYNALRPQGGPDWQLRFQLTVVY